MWPITGMRVRVGWGEVPLECWPKEPDAPWPPEEPPNMDEIAKRRRAGYYQRVRSSEEARTALGVFGAMVGVGLHITRQWLRGRTDGAIDLPGPRAEFVGMHHVMLYGYRDGRFRFHNAAWQTWGDKGFGWLPYEYFDRHRVDAFVLNPRPPAMRAGHVMTWQALSPLGHPFVGMYVNGVDEVEGWAFAFARGGYLDVEELFIRPAYRRRGKAALLVRDLRRLCEAEELPIRVWVPLADADRPFIAGARAMAERLGVVLQPSALPGTRYVGVGAAGPAGTLLRPV
jgi:GNAT superfamily N-acetyltransferase